MLVILEDFDEIIKLPVSVSNITDDGVPQGLCQNFT